MSEFTPAQLDALEDALDELDLLGGVPSDPAVAQRLDDYREILQWTRDAMPLQEVTPGLLDGVLDEARSVAPVAVIAAEPAPQGTSWWKKLRGVLLVPALAVAGSAALVLLLVRPGAKQEDDATLAARGAEPARAEAEAADEAAQRQLEASEPAGALDKGIADASVDQELSRGRLRLEEQEPAERGAAAIEGEQDARAQAAPSRAPAVEPPPPPAPSPEPAAKKKEKPSDKIYYDEGGDAQEGRKSGAAGGAPGGVPAPAAPQTEQASRAPQPEAPAPDADAKKDEAPAADDDSAGAWGMIAAADQARRAGDCSAARPKYKALAGAKDARVRARALAGLGLCETNEKAAEGWFGKARKADPDIAGFIAHERGSKPAQADQAESSL